MPHHISYPAVLAESTWDRPKPTAEERAAGELVRRAREQGLSLTGPGGLLKQMTKAVLETALDQELTEHLGHEGNGPVVNEAGNVRNGSRPKTVLTKITRTQRGAPDAPQAEITPPTRPVHGRPWKRRRCTPTATTVHTDRPNSTDARPLYVRGQRNMPVYSDPR